MTRKPAPLLRTALGLNLILSLATGLAAVLFGPVVAAMIGHVPPWLMTGLGAGLLVFAAGIAFALLHLRIGFALLISGLDGLWVILTLPLILVPGLLTLHGAALVVGLAAVVGALGTLQLAGIRALFRADAPPGQYRHCIRLRSSADPAQLWRVVRDLGGIARYSAGLSASRLEAEGDVAPGAVRVCTNTRGQSWAEEVVGLDDAVRSVAFRFRSEAPDFPFPLAGLSGGWMVTPNGRDGAFVDVWWTITPKQRRFGWLVLALMTIPLDRDLPRVVGAMAAAANGEQLPRRSALAFSYC